MNEEPRKQTESGYGWLMVVMAAVGMVGTLPGRTHGLGMITERLLADPALGLDRVLFARMNFWATLIGALFCLGSGWLIDRFGSRRVMSATVLLLGATVLAMCRAGDKLSFFLLLTLTRGLGQSALSVVSLTLVGKWFRQRQSAAMGLFSVLVAMGFMTAFGVYGEVHEQPWRSVWSSMGWGLVLVVAPLTWLLVRDGFAAGAGSDEMLAADSRERAKDWTLRDALATPAFWVFGLATSVYGLIGAGTSLFNESILAERGFPASAFYQVAIAGALVGLPANFFGGWLAQGRTLRGVTAVALVILGISLAALPAVSTNGQLWAYAVGMGASGGIVTVVFFTVWGQLYGQAYLGRIQGVAQMLTVLASAAGPQLLAEWHARTGSYIGFLYAMAGLVSVLCVATLLTPLPRREGALQPVDEALRKPIPTGE